MFERKDWRVSYNSLIVLENLLTHGPESVAAEFEVDKGVIQQMAGFQHIDEKGSVVLIWHFSCTMYRLMLCFY